MASGGWNLESQKTEIRDLLKTPLVKGDKWYLLATSWFKQWKKYVGYESWDAFNVGQIEAHPGLIENSPILEDDTGKLKEDLIDELDYQLVPLDAWNKLVSCYGLLHDQIPIERYVIEQGMFVKQCKVEVYLLKLKMCQKQFQSECVIRSISRTDALGDVLESIREIFDVPFDVEIRLFYKYMSNSYDYLSKMESTLQDAAVYCGQVIAFEAYKDGNLVLTPYKPLSKALKQKKKITKPAAAYYIVEAKQTQKQTDGKALKQKKKITKPAAASYIVEAKQTQIQTDGEEIISEVNKQTKKVTKADVASNTGEKQTQMPTDGKLLFSRYCEPCFRGNKESITFSWCSDCEEPLCFACDEAHRISKVSMSHTAIAVDKISFISPITVSSYVLCEVHPEINMEFYCSQHSLLCCRACIPTVHRTCNILSIEDVSKNAKQSALFEKLSIDVKELLHSTECLKQGHSNNLDEIIQQELAISSKIKELKSVYDKHFEKLETKLENEMKQLKQKVVSKVNQNENAIDKLSISLKKHKADFQFVTDHGSNKQAFMLANILKPEIEKKESELNELIALERKMVVQFESDVDALYLDNAIKSIGTIKFSETSIEHKNIRPSIAQGMKAKEEK